MVCVVADAGVLRVRLHNVELGYVTCQLNVICVPIWIAVSWIGAMARAGVGAMAVAGIGAMAIAGGGAMAIAGIGAMAVASGGAMAIAGGGAMAIAGIGAMAIANGGAMAKAGGQWGGRVRVCTPVPSASGIRAWRRDGDV